MLAYHPALDPYHTAFRTVQLILFHEREYIIDVLRILDFFMVFPEEIPNIRIPQEHVRWRSMLTMSHNRYWYSGDRLLTFAQMRVIQDTAFSLLYSQRLIEPTAFRSGRIILQTDQIPSHIKAIAQNANRDQSRLLTFLTSVLAELPLRGKNGLKDRTKLMEFRYDDV